MGSVIDLNDWRINSMQGPVCAIAGCPNKPTNQCPKCSTYYCFEHVKSHLHMERPEDRHDQNDDINRMRYSFFYIFNNARIKGHLRS
jgi:hypothetical protein